MSPICISDEKVELSGWGYIAGWGITKEKGFQSHELLEATLPIFDTNKCNMRYGGKIDAETQFCAGYSKLKSENALTYNVHHFNIDQFKWVFTLDRAALMHVAEILVVPLSLLTETHYQN